MEQIKTLYTQNQKIPGTLSLKGSRGFTLLEIVLVLAIMSAAYSLLVPNLGLNQATEIAVRLSRLGSDFRSAYDMSVLSGKPHRLVFHLYSGDYWLESTEQTHILLGDELQDHDLPPEDAQAEAEYKKEAFQEYLDLAAEDVVDEESGESVAIASPVVKAESLLLGASWRKVKSMEWRFRSLGPELMIADVSVSHLSEPQIVEDLETDAVVYIYMLPSGYLEKAVMHLRERIGDGYDPDRPPYTLVTSPWTGEIDIRDGYEEESVRDEI
ncbi:MAG: Tfp pilus assembly protein FimT/FimU [Oligoflexales bacterium]